MLILNPHKEPEWLDEGGDDPWSQDLQVNETPEPIGELDINDDYSELLTADEQAQLATGHIAGVHEQGGLPEDDEDNLLSALTTELEDDDSVSDDSATSYEDLMAGLVEEVGGHRISPVANSGDDMEVASSDDDTAVVRLDGSDSYDPNERIQRWLWKDGRGKVIGEVAKIRVRLSNGKHRFELSVLDDDGVWTTDTTFITVQ